MEEKKWYVIHTCTGQEDRVKAALEQRTISMKMQDKIFRILVPVEKELLHKEGRGKTRLRKVFPGYILVEMIMDEGSWFVVRNTPGVTGFVGPKSRPVPLDGQEINLIMKRMGLLEVRADFEVDQPVKITDGPLEGLEGIIKGIDREKGKLKVSVFMFGKETLAELAVSQAEKE